MFLVSGIFFFVYLLFYLSILLKEFEIQPRLKQFIITWISFWRITQNESYTLFYNVIAEVGDVINRSGNLELVIIE